MKNVPVYSTKSLQRCLLCGAALLVFFSVPLYGQIYSNEELFTLGETAYSQGNFPVAARFLFAYIQRNPAPMQMDRIHAESVWRGLGHSEEEMYKAIRERDNLRSRPAQPSSGNRERISGGQNPSPPPLQRPQAGSWATPNDESRNRQAIERLQAQLQCWHSHPTDAQQDMRKKCLQQVWERFQ